jgi:hypothetical protein
MISTSTSSSNNIDILSIEIMNRILIDTSDYLNRMDQILSIDTDLMNKMILIASYDIYIHWDGSLDDNNIDIEYIIEEDYRSLLTYILHSEYAYHSTILLIYTINRYLYPNMVICIGVSGGDMILYEWSSYVAMGYRNICNINDLVGFLTTQEGWKGELPEWSDTDITVMIPSYGGEGPYYDMRLNVLEYIEDNDIDRETKRRLYTSILVSSNIDTYKLLMKELPPYCYKGRRYTYNENINFIFE